MSAQKATAKWVLLAVLASSPAISKEVAYGRVVAISDGDTIRVLTRDLRQLRIRLAGIDAPEKRQAFGQRSKEHLSDAVFGKNVTLECGKVDRYGRNVCLVTIDGQDISLSQIKVGMAWWYRKYAQEQTSRQRKEYEAAETDARMYGRGLWSDSTPVPPWEWRRNRSSIVR